MSDDCKRPEWNLSTKLTAAGLAVAVIGLFVSWKETSSFIFFPSRPEFRMPVLTASDVGRSSEFAGQNGLQVAPHQLNEIDSLEEIPLEKRLLLTSGIASDYSRDRALAEILREAITTNNEKIALKAAGRIQSGYSASEAYISIVRWCLQLDRIECARMAAALISSTSSADDAWRSIAIACNAAGESRCVTSAIANLNSSYVRESVARDISK